MKNMLRYIGAKLKKLASQDPDILIVLGVSFAATIMACMLFCSLLWWFIAFPLYNFEYEIETDAYANVWIFTAKVVVVVFLFFFIWGILKALRNVIVSIRAKSHQ